MIFYKIKNSPKCIQYVNNIYFYKKDLIETNIEF